jgi:hypothetical protein
VRGFAGAEIHGSARATRKLVRTNELDDSEGVVRTARTAAQALLIGVRTDAKTGFPAPCVLLRIMRRPENGQGSVQREISATRKRNATANRAKPSERNGTPENLLLVLGHLL